MKKIVGYEKEKRELEVLSEMLKNADKYRQNGVRIPRGLLLSGEPGVGKTVMARSMAKGGIKLIELRAATCCDEDAADEVKKVFERAKLHTPSILLLDEIDKIAGESKSFFMEDNDRVKKTLLQELDNLSDTDNVLVVATCNDDDCMGQALIRPGRFDRQIRIDLPDEQTRKAILKSYFTKIKADKCFDLDALSRNTVGFSGAKLECLANDAGILALGKENPTIDEDDIRLSINKLEFGANEKDPFEDFASLHRVAVHEAGHAFAALYLCPDNLYGASVMPQGESGGHIRFIPNEDRVQTVSELENETAVLLAGHVAERINLGEYLTGSGRDIERAAMNMHYLVAREAAYGYDSVLSGVFRGPNDLSSETLKSRLAETIEDKLLMLDSRVEQLIYDRPEVYAKICHALEEKRVLTREDLLKIKKEAAEKSAA